MSDKSKPFVVGEYYQTSAEKQDFLRKIFDRTAPYYEGIARWGWFGSGGIYRRMALKRNGVKLDMKVIDVASGTGPVARALMEILDSPDQITCVEPSAGMIAESRKTVPAVHHQSTAEALPVPDESFDYLTMGFALRHVDSLEDSFAEFRRVLKDGGTAFIMDVTMPDSAVGRVFFKAYFKHILPFFTLVFSRDREAYRLMKYYWDTMEQMTDREDVVEFLRKAGFREATHRVYLGCFSEYIAVR
ncbi:class I SAM-dependent methyltransferase [Rhodobacteraceae bacterium NNCM2]|nr:class I SAM-dependent methyltransferase [Coraliihabitans acroporae]